MSLLRDILSELLGMFVADARLTAAILATVLAAAALIAATAAPPLVGGVFLLVGSIAVLVVGVRREARRHAAGTTRHTGDR